MVKKDLVEEVIEIKRLDDKIIKTVIVCIRKIPRVFSVYPLQQCRSKEEKRDFLRKLLDIRHDFLKRILRQQNKITNDQVKRRCGVENLEHRLRKTRLR